MNMMLNNFRAYITSLAVLTILGGVTQLSAQQENIEIRLGGRGGSSVVGGPGSANYDLAARFAPYKIQDMVTARRSLRTGSREGAVLVRVGEL
ncbi:MAG: hypothetical protein CM1200mP14_20680 [Gammaproteobacteria bacterium]|nr:MAG: hypothetical protein CM1200mP14_20680 [Gammaproteobacteria bacterium]